MQLCFSLERKNALSQQFKELGVASTLMKVAVLSVITRGCFLKKHSLRFICLCGRLNVEMSSHIPQVSVQRTLSNKG